MRKPAPDERTCGCRGPRPGTHGFAREVLIEEVAGRVWATIRTNAAAHELREALKGAIDLAHVVMEEHPDRLRLLGGRALRVLFAAGIDRQRVSDVLANL